MPAVIFVALLDLGKKSSFVDRHYLDSMSLGGNSLDFEPYWPFAQVPLDVPV
jgi:hypothetical protein